MKIEMRDPLSLKLHPIFEHTYHPMMPEDSAQWHCMLEDVRRHGVKVPLLITQDGLVLDGRHRLKTSLATAKKQVPCVIRDGAEAAEAVAESLLLRRNYTKSGLALQLAAMAELAAEDGKRVRSNLPGSKKSNVLLKPHSVGVQENPLSIFSTLESLSAKYGVGLETLRMARKVHELLDQVGDHPGPSGMTKRDWTHMMIYQEEKGFQPVLAALAMNLKNGTHAESCAPGKRSNTLKYITEAFERPIEHWKKWEDIPQENRESFVDVLLPKAVEAWPEEVKAKAAALLVSYLPGRGRK